MSKEDENSIPLRDCGDDFPQWFGRCPSCKEWNTLRSSTRPPRPRLVPGLFRQSARRAEEPETERLLSLRRRAGTGRALGGKAANPTKPESVFATGADSPGRPPGASTPPISGRPPAAASRPLRGRWTRQRVPRRSRTASASNRSAEPERSPSRPVPPPIQSESPERSVPSAHPQQRSSCEPSTGPVPRRAPAPRAPAGANSRVRRSPSSADSRRGIGGTAGPGPCFPGAVGAAKPAPAQPSPVLPSVHAVGERAGRLPTLFGSGRASGVVAAALDWDRRVRSGSRGVSSRVGRPDRGDPGSGSRLCCSRPRRKLVAAGRRRSTLRGRSPRVRFASGRSGSGDSAEPAHSHRDEPRGRVAQAVPRSVRGSSSSTRSRPRICPGLPRLRGASPR